MRFNVQIQRLIDRLPRALVVAPFARIAELRWSRRGKPSPAPPSIKRATLRSYASDFDLDVLVETGTFLGDTVQAMLPHFREIFSIELSRPLYERAARRFRGDPKVVLLHGDSAAELPRILDRLDAPALFWLDGHYSAGFTAKGRKDTPIVEELHAILNSRFAHVVLVDDARLFNGTQDYPTLEELTRLVYRLRPGYSVTVADDIIRLVPSATR